MKFRLTSDDYTEGVYDNLSEVETEILRNFGEGTLPLQVIEVNDNGDEMG